MAFENVVQAFKQMIPSSRINQLQENIVVHDHRVDGSQGHPLAGDWEDIPHAFSAGWSLNGHVRGRKLFDGKLVQIHAGIHRDGATITAGVNGGIPASQILNGIDAAWRPDADTIAILWCVSYGVGTGVTGGPFTARIWPDGTLSLHDGPANGKVLTGNNSVIVGSYWLDSVAV